MRRILIGAVTVTVLITTGCHVNTNNTNNSNTDTNSTVTTRVVLPTLVCTTSEVVTSG